MKAVRASQNGALLEVPLPLYRELLRLADPTNPRRVGRSPADVVEALIGRRNRHAERSRRAHLRAKERASCKTR
jgi:hypothetical protein